MFLIKMILLLTLLMVVPQDVGGIVHPCWLNPVWCRNRAGAGAGAGKNNKIVCSLFSNKGALHCITFGDETFEYHLIL